LSLPALMVLQPGGCGRVRNRRHQTTNTQLNTTTKGIPLKHHQFQRSAPFFGFPPAHRTRTGGHFINPRRSKSADLKADTPRVKEFRSESEAASSR
ncbi:hypothetical protein QP922_12320, partial [Corynebacterium sp. MSK218]|uniref:hypothetical protein n=1 Tax=Corynebacterium sp. MSK218 TaxID=3050218 RepID=UPI00254C9303